MGLWHKSDERLNCTICGKELPFHIVPYVWHDERCSGYDYYKKVDREHVTVINGDSFCNICYENLDDIIMKDIIRSGYEFLNTRYSELQDELNTHYNNKLAEIEDLKTGVETVLAKIKDKSKVSQLTQNEINTICTRIDDTGWLSRTLKIGYPYFKCKYGLEEFLEHHTQLP